MATSDDMENNLSGTGESSAVNATEEETTQNTSQEPSGDSDESGATSVEEPGEATDNESGNETDNEADNESGNETDNESDGDGDAYITSLADTLRATDNERFEKIAGVFASDEPFDDADIDWISTTLGESRAKVKYVLALQRETFKIQQSNDTTIAEAEKEVGPLNELLDFARAHAPAEKLAEWQAIADSNKRLSELAGRRGDKEALKGANHLTLTLLREIKEFKDTLPATSGGRVKTLGHLASAQANKTPPPAPKADAPPEPAVNPIYQELSRMNSSYLAQLHMNPRTDSAVSSQAERVLRERGII